MNPDGLPSIGDTLAGKYQLTRKLGQGGMGVVYEATHLRLGQKVAIKLVLPEVAERPELAYRFDQEARAAVRLRGRHTVRVFDVDTSPQGLPYIVMELLEGQSLRDELAQRGPLPIEDAVRYVREACEGVDEAHRAGIVHRDLKPANLFLSTEPNGSVIVKVVDFGIAKASDVTDPGYHTATNAPLGTYKYMSPEQARSARSVDGRTDVWSLGVVLYQLLSGKTPFQGEGALGVVYAIATQAPPPLRALRPDVPEALVAVVERALCKELAGRYQTVRALSDDLAPFDVPRLSMPPRAPSMPLLTPLSGIQRPAPVSGGPPLTPALGITPHLHTQIEHAPTQPDPSPLAASGGRGEARRDEPAHRATAARLSQPPGDGPPNDNSVAQNHAVPIKPRGLGVGSPAMPLWLAGAAAVLAGAATLGVQAARRRSDTAALVAAPPSAPASRDASARVRAEPPPILSVSGPNKPPLIAPADGAPPDTLEARQGAERAGGAAPAAAAPNGSFARTHARPRPSKAQASKAGAEPAVSAPPPPEPKKTLGAEDVFP